MRLSFLLVLSIFLVGCSATRQPITYDNTNIRLERIERNILERNREIEDIKFSLENLSSKVDQIALQSPMEDDVIGGQDFLSSPESTDSSSGGSLEKVIRVPVSEKQIQIALKNAGYYDGPIDGKIGKKSIQAIKDFQKDFDLKVDGIIGKQTWSEMKKYLE